MGFKILMNYLLAPNETLRDVGADVEAILSVLDALESIHKVFLGMLLHIQGVDKFLLPETPVEDDCEDPS